MSGRFTVRNFYLSPPRACEPSKAMLSNLLFAAPLELRGLDRIGKSLSPDISRVDTEPSVVRQVQDSVRSMCAVSRPQPLSSLTPGLAGRNYTGAGRWRTCGTPMSCRVLVLRSGFLFGFALPEPSVDLVVPLALSGFVEAFGASVFRAACLSNIVYRMIPDDLISEACACQGLRRVFLKVYLPLFSAIYKAR